MVESFFATLKIDLVHRRSWPTPEQVRSAIVDYIEVFYNRRWRHSSLGYQSPVDYEERFNRKSTQAA